MNIREIKKVVNNLNAMVERYEELMALKRNVEKPENIGNYPSGYIRDIEMRMEKIEKTLLKTINF